MCRVVVLSFYVLRSVVKVSSLVFFVVSCCRGGVGFSGVGLLLWDGIGKGGREVIGVGGRFYLSFFETFSSKERMGVVVFGEGSVFSSLRGLYLVFVTGMWVFEVEDIVICYCCLDG